MHLARFQLTHQADEPLDAAPKAVEFPDDQRVTFAQDFQNCLQTRANGP